MTKGYRILLAGPLVFFLLGPGVSTAQDPQPLPRAARLAPADVQRLFDAYTLMQAQDALKLSDQQYSQFVTRMKALQDVRHRNQQARQQLLREIERLSADSATDERALRDRLTALREQDVKMAGDLQKAYAGVDEVLDARQQARFRLFEESMERKKFDLLMRARQRGRARLNREPPAVPER